MGRAIVYLRVGSEAQAERRPDPDEKGPDSGSPPGRYTVFGEISNRYFTTLLKPFRLELEQLTGTVRDDDSDPSPPANQPSR